MEKDSFLQFIIITFVLLVLFVIMERYMVSCQERFEQFNANNFDNPDIDLLDRTLDDSMTPHTHHHVVHHLSAEDFTQMIFTIRNIITDTLIKAAESCKGMNGADKLGDGSRDVSLICNTDPWELEERTVLRITDYIRGYIKDKFNINLNNYQIIHDMMRHLNLLEAVIYPLRYSGLYTVHGIQYTTERFIRQRVEHNLDIKDVLYTTLTRRNISLMIDTDRHIQ